MSPRLGIRFDLSEGELQLFEPSGKRFLTFAELSKRHEEALGREAEARRLAALEKQRAKEERQRADKLTARRRALGVDPEKE